MVRGMKNASKSMNGRTLVVLIAFILVAAVLLGRLFNLQVFSYDMYLGKVLDNLMQISVIKAERGAIYDRNMQPLAVNITTYRVFISPADIEEKDREPICKKLSEILDVQYDEIMKKALKTGRKDETIKKDVEKNKADEVRTFIAENKYTRQIYLEATSKRYYPAENLAAQVIGYLGTDGGLFGLEMKYNGELTGTDGKYITARNAKSQSMPSKYDTKIDPKNGYSLVTTLDMNIQAILQNQLEQTYKENLAQNDVCGIVMDVHTGAILGMSTNWGFNLNTPFVLTDEYKDELTFSGLDPESDEYNEKKWELIYSMWRNKCVSDTYEPGSTFKIITSAIGLETGVVTPDTVLTCSGSLNVAGSNIRCHKHSGHGTNSFSYLLQQSCNPAMMQTVERIGKNTFWSYFEDFGYTSKTGVDLPGESSGINHSFSRFNAVEMATSSFGQTFRTTPIQQLTAICAVANGGHLVTPHVVQSLVDEDGNAVVNYEENTTKRQILSEEVCRELAEILEGGVLEGVARNAYVAGYHVAAKTGTSEKRDSPDKTLRVGSTVAFAPANDPQIAVLIVVDEPAAPTKSGGVVAAPYVANVMNEALQYLGVGRDYSEEEMKGLSFEVDAYEGKSTAEAMAQIEKAGVTCRILGEGSTVYAQIPAAGQKMRVEGGVVYLYAYDPAGELPTDKAEEVTVPDVTGYKVSAAIALLTSNRLNVQITGSLNYQAGTGAIVTSQSIAGKTKVPEGTIVVIESTHTDVADNN